MGLSSHTSGAMPTSSSGIGLYGVLVMRVKAGYVRTHRTQPSTQYFLPSQTALQIYCETYKQVPLEESYGLLRRANRLDRAQQLPRPSPAIGPPPNLNCCVCKTEYTPHFWPTEQVLMDAKDDGVVCHRCKVGGPRSLVDAKEEAISVTPPLKVDTPKNTTPKDLPVPIAPSPSPPLPQTNGCGHDHSNGDPVKAPVEVVNGINGVHALSNGVNGIHASNDHPMEGIEPSPMISIPISQKLVEPPNLLPLKTLLDTHNAMDLSS